MEADTITPLEMPSSATPAFTLSQALDFTVLSLRKRGLFAQKSEIQLSMAVKVYIAYLEAKSQQRRSYTFKRDARTIVQRGDSAPARQAKELAGQLVEQLLATALITEYTITAVNKSYSFVTLPHVKIHQGSNPPILQPGI